MHVNFCPVIKVYLYWSTFSRSVAWWWRDSTQVGTFKCIFVMILRPKYTLYFFEGAPYALSFYMSALIISSPTLGGLKFHTTWFRFVGSFRSSASGSVPTTRGCLLFFPHLVTCLSLNRLPMILLVIHGWFSLEKSRAAWQGEWHENCLLVWNSSSEWSLMVLVANFLWAEEPNRKDIVPSNITSPPWIKLYGSSSLILQSLLAWQFGRGWFNCSRVASVFFSPFTQFKKLSGTKYPEARWSKLKCLPLGDQLDQTILNTPRNLNYLYLAAIIPPKWHWLCFDARETLSGIYAIQRFIYTVYRFAHGPIRYWRKSCH